MTKSAKVAVVLAVMALITACGGSASAEPPKPPGWHEITTPELVDNVYTWCDHGNRIYQTYQAIAVAAADPSCAAVPR
jgi:ABC-type glycerol-3-phosphate transport system substrate-binding protein